MRRSEFTTSISGSHLFEAVRKLQADSRDTKALVIAIRRFIIDHADTIPNEDKRQPQTIIESRFTTAEEAFDTGMLSCGALANISSKMLRSLGYDVKLIHGESQNSVDHAWISVRDPVTHEWVEYDITRPEVDIPETHMKKREVGSWEEIENEITSDHESLRARRKARYIRTKNQSEG